MRHRGGRGAGIGRAHGGVSQQGPRRAQSEAVGVREGVHRHHDGVKKWRAYLQHAEFLILTDHCSLAHLGDQRLHTPWQQKVFTKLLGLQFQIKYKKGIHNRAADALSWRPAPDSCLLTVTQYRPTWMLDIVEAYTTDPIAQELLTRLTLSSPTEDHYSLRDGLIRYKDRIWIPNNTPMRTKILEALHYSPLRGHSGIPVTLRRIKQNFYWKGIRASVHHYMQECTVCQRAKPDRAKYPNLLAALAVHS